MWGCSPVKGSWLFSAKGVKPICTRFGPRKTDRVGRSGH